MRAGSSHSSSAGQESSPILQEKGSERSGDTPRPAARAQTPDPRHGSLPVLALSQGDWPSRPQESPALAGPQLRASLAFLAVNPTGAAANPVEERAQLSARLCFVKGAPQARQDSGMPTGPPKLQKPRRGQPLVLLLQEALPALTGPSADSSGFRLLS